MLQERRGTVVFLSSLECHVSSTSCGSFHDVIRTLSCISQRSFMTFFLLYSHNINLFGHCKLEIGLKAQIMRDCSSLLSSNLIRIYNL